MARVKRLFPISGIQILTSIRKPVTSIMMFYLKNVFIKKNGVLFNEMSRSNIIEYNRRSLL